MRMNNRINKLNIWKKAVATFITKRGGITDDEAARLGFSYEDIKHWAHKQGNLIKSGFIIISSLPDDVLVYYFVKQAPRPPTMAAVKEILSESIGSVRVNEALAKLIKERGLLVDERERLIANSAYEYKIEEKEAAKNQEIKANVYSLVEFYKYISFKTLRERLDLSDAELRSVLRELEDEGKIDVYWNSEWVHLNDADREERMFKFANNSYRWFDDEEYEYEFYGEAAVEPKPLIILIGKQNANLAKYLERLKSNSIAIINKRYDIFLNVSGDTLIDQLPELNKIKAPFLIIANAEERFWKYSQGTLQINDDDIFLAIDFNKQQACLSGAWIVLNDAITNNISILDEGNYTATIINKQEFEVNLGE